MTPAVLVRHAGGEYPVFVAPGALDGLAGYVASWLPGRRVAVVTDRTVARAVPHRLEGPALVVAPGEASKSRARWSALTDRLLALGFGRDSALVAVGGGVVGDLAGFVAATYLRGIPWVMVPTSLLAMVDAAVGGKTGVNTRHGKNLVGAFHPPAAVLADPAVLGTLHPDHRAAGLVEAVKHGLVADRDYFDWIAREVEPLRAGDVAAQAELVVRSVRIKAAIVSEDERETGRRAVLNAGHTVGHAIERVTDYAVRHGDAVAIGLVTEARLAVRAGLADPGLVGPLRALLERLSRPVAPNPAWPVEALLAAMQYDKKAREGAIRFALPNTLGRMARHGPDWTVPIAPELVRAVLSDPRS